MNPHKICCKNSALYMRHKNTKKKCVLKPPSPLAHRTRGERGNLIEDYLALLFVFYAAKYYKFGETLHLIPPNCSPLPSPLAGEGLGVRGASNLRNSFVTRSATLA